MAGRNLYHTKRFSSQSYTPGSAMQRASSVRSAGYLTSAAAPRVNIKPLSLEVPHFEDGQAFQELRNQEKEQIKGLNNQFACFIDKVKQRGE